MFDMVHGLNLLPQQSVFGDLFEVTPVLTAKSRKADDSWPLFNLGCVVSLPS
jgi:hypothetical protein